MISRKGDNFSPLASRDIHNFLCFFPFRTNGAETLRNAQQSSHLGEILKKINPNLEKIEGGLEQLAKNLKSN